MSVLAALCRLAALLEGIDLALSRSADSLTDRVLEERGRPVGVVPLSSPAGPVAGDAVVAIATGSYQRCPGGGERRRQVSDSRVRNVRATGQRVLVGVTSDQGDRLEPDAARDEVHEAVRKLLGPAIAEHVVTHVELAGRAVGDWIRAAMVSQVLRDEGMRRYSERRRGLVPFGPVDVAVWRDRRDLSRRNAFLDSERD
jgi:hypothetical protein